MLSSLTRNLDCLHEYACFYPWLILPELRLNGDECGWECWWLGDPEYEIHLFASEPQFHETSLQIVAPVCAAES